MTWGWEFWSIGRVHTVRDNLGRFAKGHRKCPEEIVEKISESNKGQTSGHKWTPDEAKIFNKKQWEKVSQEERCVKMDKIRDLDAMHDGARRYWEKVRNGEIEHPITSRDPTTGRFM